VRTKHEILNELRYHAKNLDPQHYDLAEVAITETEVQLDVRDILSTLVIILKEAKEIVYQSD